MVEVRQGTLGREWSWLRSGREHWAWMVVVEVRQRTLWIAGRSWTRRTRRTTRRRRRRRGGDEEEMRRRGEEQATDIKSNNPHLAGGEKNKDILCSQRALDFLVYSFCVLTCTAAA